MDASSFLISICLDYPGLGPRQSYVPCLGKSNRDRHGAPSIAFFAMGGELCRGS